MNADRWARIKDLFDEALALAPADRDAFLDRAAPDDADLRQEVRSLLAADAAAVGFSGALVPGAAEIEPLSPQPGLLLGQSLDHFRIDAVLGAGGMGVVYRAYDTRLERTVALKVVSDRSLDPEARQRLVREARHASALSHPNICTMYEIGDIAGDPFIAMEYIDGEPLDRIVARGPLPVRQVLEYGLQIAGALAHAHGRGILHRDLKASNIVIAGDGRATILDFGVARRLDANAVDRASRSDLDAPIAGTLAYMAPEVLRGQPADARADIWALGIVLHELLAGAAPFSGETGFALSSAILHEPPAALPPDVPNGVAAVVTRCLEKDPQRRYQQATDVQADLERAQRTLERRRGRTVLVTGAAAIAAIAVLGAAWLAAVRVRSGGPPPIVSERSLAVLPLDNLSGRADQDYFADGLTDALITDLSQIHALRVVSRTTIQTYKGSHAPLPDIARALHVDLVVEGSVVRTGDHVRVTAQLIDAGADRHLWARSYERSIDDVVSLQREVARAIAREIGVTVTPREEARLAPTATINPEAHEAYLEGRYAWNKRTEASMKQALEYFNRAVAIDPKYAPAYAGIADTYNLMQFYSGYSPNVVFPPAREAAERALALDEALPEAHAALAYVLAFYDWKWADAEREFRRTLELEPNNADVYHSFSRFLAATGRIDESLANLKHAQELEPTPLIFKANEGITFYFARQYDRTIEQLNKVLELDPTFDTANWGLGLAYEQKHDYGRAIREFEHASATSPGSANVLGSLGHAYALAGRRDDAMRVLSRIEEIGRTHYVPSFFSAEVYLGLGDNARALELLEKSYEEHSTLLGYAKMDPRLDPIRNNPQFAGLLRRIGLSGSAGVARP
ncbi:MAG TPA: protein kinase [Vicinamibacterales bacterium]